MFEQRKAREAMHRRIVATILLLIIGVAAYFADDQYIQPKYQEIKAGLEHNTAFARQINSVTQERDQYLLRLAETGKKYGSLVSGKDDYIAFLDNVALENQLVVSKLTVGDLTQEGRIYTLSMQIELEGDLYNIKNMIQQLSDSENIVRINSFSYRQIQTEATGGLLSWLRRDLDNKTLIQWWTEGGADVVSKYGSGSAPTADALLAQGPALCYLDIDFIGTGG